MVRVMKISKSWDMRIVDYQQTLEQKRLCRLSQSWQQLHRGAHRQVEKMASRLQVVGYSCTPVLDVIHGQLSKQEERKVSERRKARIASVSASRLAHAARLPVIVRRAAAAIHIQRIFRGWHTRRYWKGGRTVSCHTQRRRFAGAAMTPRTSAAAAALRADRPPGNPVERTAPGYEANNASAAALDEAAQATDGSALDALYHTAKPLRPSQEARRRMLAPWMELLKREGRPLMSDALLLGIRKCRSAQVASRTKLRGEEAPKSSTQAKRVDGALQALGSAWLRPPRSKPTGREGPITTGT